MKSIEKCYEILGVPPSATKDQVKQAYHDLAKVWHPDRFMHDKRLQSRAQEKLKEINEAYTVVMSPQAYAAGPSSWRPKTAQSTKPAARPREPRPKDKYRMRSYVSIITLLIAIAIVSMIFFIYGWPYELVHSQKAVHELM